MKLDLTRQLRICLLCILVCCASWPAALSNPTLESLYRSHHWFQLRSALRQNSPPLYRGAVAGAFDQIQEAEPILNALIARAPTSKDAYEAHEWLTYLYLRRGQYSSAVKEHHKKVASSPERANSGEEAFMQAFALLPDQRTEHFVPTHVRYTLRQGDVMAPLRINGTEVSFVLDTDANVSAMSELQAERLGIEVKSGARAFGTTGAATEFRVGVAGRVQINNIVIQNVAFWIYPDNQEPFHSYSLGERGLIGLPLLRALKTIHWTKGGTLDVGFPGVTQQTAMNLCFDGSDLLTEGGREGKRLEFLLDTGNEVTEFWPPFARQFPALMNAGEKGTEALTGVGATASIPSVKLTNITLTLGGQLVTLDSVPVLLARTTPSSAWYSGRIGIDTLMRAQSATLDFERMRFSLR
jgi:hypothetical protein